VRTGCVGWMPAAGFNPVGLLCKARHRFDSEAGLISIPERGNIEPRQFEVKAYPDKWKSLGMNDERLERMRLY